jgi:plasmid maintenance system antidote protein VapI
LRADFSLLKLIPCAVAAALTCRAPGWNASRGKKKPGTADTALRLGKFFKTGAAFWMNMQARCDQKRPKTCSRRSIRKIASDEAA